MCSSDLYHFEKYTTNASQNLNIWIWFQFLTTFGFLFYFYGHITQIGFPMIFVYGAFIFITVWAYTELMDKNPNAIIYESIKNALGLGFIVYTGGWFGLENTAYSWCIFLMVGYFIVSTFVTYWFVKYDMADTEIGVLRTS